VHQGICSNYETQPWRPQEKSAELSGAKDVAQKQSLMLDLDTVHELKANLDMFHSTQPIINTN